MAQDVGLPPAPLWEKGAEFLDPSFRPLVTTGIWGVNQWVRTLFVTLSASQINQKEFRYKRKIIWRKTVLKKEKNYWEVGKDGDKPSPGDPDPNPELTARSLSEGGPTVMSTLEV